VHSTVAAVDTQLYGLFRKPNFILQERLPMRIYLLSIVAIAVACTSPTEPSRLALPGGSLRSVQPSTSPIVHSAKCVSTEKAEKLLATGNWVLGDIACAEGFLPVQRA
jgi:hypothetical protein